MPLLKQLADLRARIEVKALAVWIALAAAAWGFLTLASEMGEGETTGFDTYILTALRQPAIPPLPSVRTG